MLKYFATIAVSIKRTKGRLWPDEYEDEDDSNQSCMFVYTSLYTFLFIFGYVATVKLSVRL